jgi:hypothetical protein
MSNIKELVSKKLSLLINILFSNDKDGWATSLKLEDSDSEAFDHFSSLVTIVENMKSFKNLKEIPDSLIENFSQTLLSTNELSAQISKLVIKHFG